MSKSAERGSENLKIMLVLRLAEEWFAFISQGSRALAGFTGGAPSSLSKPWTPGSTGAEATLNTKLAHCNGYC